MFLETMNQRKLFSLEGLLNSVSIARTLKMTVSLISDDNLKVLTNFSVERKSHHKHNNRISISQSKI